MSRRQIRVHPGAHQALLAAPKPTRRQLLRAIDGLATHPQPSEAMTLADLPGGLRLPVGDHQVVYTVTEQEVTVLVIDRSHHP
jgi:mRNA-degrading endonuclease RelE of RelBE toxin-antitoxin system